MPANVTIRPIMNVIRRRISLYVVYWPTSGIFDINRTRQFVNVNKIFRRHIWLSNDERSLSSKELGLMHQMRGPL